MEVLMRERIWRPALAYFYAVVATWGSLVFVYPPDVISEELGHSFTIVWAVSAIVGGVLALIGVLGPLFTKQQLGYANQAFAILEMMAGIGIVLAVFMYDTVLWATVGNGLTERIGVAILFHVLALPSALRTINEMHKLLHALIEDAHSRHGMRKQ